jgi:hypothetical protein
MYVRVFPQTIRETQPSRDALHRLVEGCETVKQGCAQVEIVALVRKLQSGDASTFAEFLTGIIDPAGTGTVMDPALWCADSCTVAPVVAYFVKMEQELGKGAGPPQSLDDFVATVRLSFASNPPFTWVQHQLKQLAADESVFYQELNASLDGEEVYRWVETDEP